MNEIPRCDVLECQGCRFGRLFVDRGIGRLDAVGRRRRREATILVISPALRSSICTKPARVQGTQGKRCVPSVPRRGGLAGIVAAPAHRTAVEFQRAAVAHTHSNGRELAFRHIRIEDRPGAGADRRRGDALDGLIVEQGTGVAEADDRLALQSRIHRCEDMGMPIAAVPTAADRVAGNGRPAPHRAVPMHLEDSVGGQDIGLAGPVPTPAFD